MLILRDSADEWRRGYDGSSDPDAAAGAGSSHGPRQQDPPEGDPHLARRRVLHEEPQGAHAPADLQGGVLAVQEGHLTPHDRLAAAADFPN